MKMDKIHKFKKMDKKYKKILKIRTLDNLIFNKITENKSDKTIRIVAMNITNIVILFITVYN